MTSANLPAETDFFSDAPLHNESDDWGAAMVASIAIRARWAGHVLDCVNGHLVWRLETDQRPGACRVFYDGDYSDVLAPDDPRILVPRAADFDADIAPARLDWDEGRSTSSI